MAVSPLSGTLAKALYKGLKSVFLDATVMRDAASSNSPDIDAFDLPAPTTTNYPCKAIVETYSEYTRAVGFASESDRKVLILAQSLAITPMPNDRISVGGSTLTILNVASDPATATWECKARI